MKATRTGLMTLLTLAMLAGACSASEVSEVTVAASDSQPTTTASAVATTVAPKTSEAPAATTTAPEAISAGLPPVESAGCAAPSRQRVESVTVDHDQLTRTYDIYAPLAAGAMPLVLDFHGFRQTTSDHERMTGLGAAAVDGEFIAVMPHGTVPEGARSYFNLATTDNAELVDDVGFVEQILDDVAEQHCVDLSRVYVTGWSNGGMFASTLACVLGDRIAAAAAVSGITLREDCPDQPKPMIIFHGTLDGTVPYEDAEPGDLAETIAVLGANDAQVEMFSKVVLNPVEYIDLWIEHNDCALDPATSEGLGALQISEYRECPTHGDVAVVIADPGGHRWMSYPTDRILDFLFQQQLPAGDLAVSSG